MNKFTEKIIRIFPFCEKIIMNKKARTKLMLRLGLMINVVYAVYNLLTGVLYGSVWFGAVAIYYLMLCAVKFFLLFRGFDPKGSRRRALKDMRISGIMLIFLNLTISLLIYRMIVTDSVHLYGRSVIAMAAGYTVFRIVAVVTDWISSKGNFDPIFFTVKGLSFSVALMSLFSLQTSILDRFMNSGGVRQGINTLTGSAVSVTVLIIGIRTVMRANKELKANN
jgi:hypothetical protein